MNELLIGVNWLAVGIGTIAAFALGALWYSPVLFVKGWAQGVGVDIDAKPEGVAATMITQFFGTFLLALVIAICTAKDQLALALLAILTIAVLLFSGGGYTQKSRYAKIVESTFVIAMGAIMIACHSLF